MAFPNKQLHAFALICVALGHADGDFDPRELAALQLALQDLGMSRGEAQATVADAVRKVCGFGDRGDAMMAAACRRVSAGLRATLFETAAHVVLADGVLGDAECLRLAALRSMLGLPEPVAIAVVASAASGRSGLKCAVSRAIAR